MMFCSVEFFSTQKSPRGSGAGGERIDVNFLRSPRNLRTPINPRADGVGFRTSRQTRHAAGRLRRL
jgi:hypothetical protein